jgi:hypothetical protein
MNRWERIRVAVAVTLVGVVVASGLGLWATGSVTPARTAATMAAADTPSPAAQPDLDPSVEGACADELVNLVAWGVRVVLPESMPDACAGVNRGTVSWKLDMLAGDACARVIASRPGPALDDPDHVCDGVPPAALRVMGERAGRPFPRGAG